MSGTGERRIEICFARPRIDRIRGSPGIGLESFSDTMAALSSSVFVRKSNQDSVMHSISGVAIGLSLLLATAQPRGAAALEPADLVLRNGRLVTVDEQRPTAHALAARGGRIVAVGTDDAVEALIGPQTRVVDLQGKLAIPGFIEGHGHFVSLGRSKMDLDLSRAKSWDEIVEQVGQAAANSPPGEWIVGRGWHQEKWTARPEPHVEGYPTHEALSRATPQHPVLLVHGTGHMSFANRAALELAGIDRDSRDPAGGTILRDEQGEPTGALRETAQSAVRRAHQQSLARRTAEQVEADAQKAIDLATRECLKKGVTSFQDAGSPLGVVDRFKRLAEQGRLQVRLWVMLNDSNSRLRDRLADARLVDYGDGFLTVRAIKRMADGALGSHGALLLEPYHDQPTSMGLRVQSLAYIQETALLAAQHDFQLCTHAIGDQANREILDLYRMIFQSHPDRRDWRWRIEHAQHLHPDDIPRFAELGVIASMQANHCTSDGPFVIARLGRTRAQIGAYAWRSLLDAGTTVINGTDVPVEDVDPLLSFHAAVSRRLADGSVFFGEQRMTREEALRSYTIDAARAAFEEHSKGSLTPGKLADIVVLSHDILTIPEEQIPDAQVVQTIVGGKIVYDRDAKKQ
jgi:predicted amidohydrolase YtcJ